MAKLILTKREEASDSLLLWSDEALGKAVRYGVSILTLNEKDSIFATAAGQILCSIAHKTNATTLTLKLTGVTEDDMALGNWKITVKRVKERGRDERIFRDK